MKPTVDRFRRDFVDNFLKVNKPYPIRTALRATTMRPNSQAIQRLIMARGDFQIAGEAVTNDAGRELEAEFEPVLNDKAFVISAVFPKPFRAVAKATDAKLSFELTTPVGVTFVSRPALGGADAIPQRARLTRVDIDASTLRYTFQADGLPDGFCFESVFGAASPPRDMQRSGPFAEEKRSANEGALEEIQLSNAICGDEWTSYSDQTVHCRGVRKRTTLNYGNDYEYECDCHGTKRTITVAAGSDAEARMQVELAFSESCR